MKTFFFENIGTEVSIVREGTPAAIRGSLLSGPAGVAYKLANASTKVSRSTTRPLTPSRIAGLPRHYYPRDAEIDHEHRGSKEDAGPNVLPEADGVLVAAEGRAAPHRHDSGPDAEVGEQPERQNEELEGADPELQQEAAAKFPGREREGSGDEDRTPNEGRNLRRDGRRREVGHQCGG